MSPTMREHPSLVYFQLRPPWQNMVFYEADFSAWLMRQLNHQNELVHSPVESCLTVGRLAVSTASAEAGRLAGVHIYLGYFKPCCVQTPLSL